MENEKIKIIYKEPLKPPEIKFVTNSTKAFEELIGGEIEVIMFEKKYLIYDKNARKKGLQLNILIDTFISIYGNVIIVNKSKESDSYISLSKEECNIYLQKIKNKAFKSAKQEESLHPKIKMVVNWDNVANSQPEMKLKRLYESRKNIMNQQNQKQKLSDEEIADRVRQILLKIKNDPRLTDEEKSEQTRIIYEKLKKVKGITFTEVKEEPKTEASSSNNGVNVISTKDTSINEIPVFDANEVLKMILAMQNTIIKFIKENTEEQ